MPEVTSKTIGSVCTSTPGSGAVTTAWWRVPPAAIRAPASSPTAARSGPPVSTTAPVSIVPVLVSTPVTWPSATRSPVKAQRSRTSTPRCTERGGVRQDVARRVDVAVAGGVRRPDRRARREAGAAAVDLVAVPPLDVQAERALQGDPVLRGGDLRVGEARHQVALRDEPRVERVPVALAGVEVAAEEAQPDRGLGAALRPHHPGRAAAGAAAQRGGLDERDGPAGLGQEARGPRADRAASDDHDVHAAHGPDPGPD